MGTRFVFLRNRTVYERVLILPFPFAWPGFCIPPLIFAYSERSSSIYPSPLPLSRIHLLE